MKRITDSVTYQADLQMVVAALGPMNRLNGKRILVTGATGLIGSAVVDLLLALRALKDINVCVIAASRSLERLHQRFGVVENLEFVEYDANSCQGLDVPADFIIQAASPSSPELYVSVPVDVMCSNLIGVERMLSHAVECACGRFVFVSSSEVYGRAFPAETGFKENDYGGIDLLNPRSSYAASKQAAETLCASYAKQYGLSVSIARPGHVYGPTATRADKRVSSFWAYETSEGRDIVMKSEGLQVRSYIHCLDCASALLTVLLLGESATAYNIANRKSRITIREMASILAEAGGVVLKKEAPTNVEKSAFNPMLNSSLDPSRLDELGWKGVFDAAKGLSHTVDALREICQG